VFFGFPGGSAGNNPPVMWETWFSSWVGKIPCRRETGLESGATDVNTVYLRQTEE